MNDLLFLAALVLGGLAVVELFKWRPRTHHRSGNAANI